MMEDKEIEQIVALERKAGRRISACRRCTILGLQITHFLFALGIAVVAVVEFAAAPSLFDLLRNYHEEDAVPAILFQNISGASMDLRRLMDLPILFLFLSYFSIIVWLRGSGLRAWLMTLAMMTVVLLLLVVNLWAADLLQWMRFSTRAASILLNAILLALGWTVIVISLFRKPTCYPLKIQHPSGQGGCVGWVAGWTWNCLALLLTLTLCLLVWFSRLYTSWVCVRDSGELLTLCQFTKQVQCRECAGSKDCGDLDTCIDSSDPQPFHCLSPVYTLGSSITAICVFNYNIGIFTFISVFAYVGGLYFILRIVLSSLVKFILAVSIRVMNSIGNIVHAHKRESTLAALMASVSTTSYSSESE